MSRKEEQTKPAETDEQPDVEVAEDEIEIEVVDEILFTPRVQTSKFALRFSPYAWTKIRWIRDYCGSEIAGFGISSMEDPFYMADFRTVKQTASMAHFQFDDDALNDYLATMFEEGKQPGECMRLWVHTHPTKNFASPSGVDEATFSDAFGNADWAMMIIVDEGDDVYARLRVKSGASQLQTIVHDSVDYQPPFRGIAETDAAAWKQEADANITRAARRQGNSEGQLVLPAAHIRRHLQHYDLSDFDPNAFDSYSEPHLRELSDGHSGVSTRGSPWENIETLLTDEERVVGISTEKRSGGVLVLLNNIWLVYSADVTPKCQPGAIVKEPEEIAEVAPLRCGELDWKIDEKNGTQTPVYVSEVIDGFVQFFDEDDPAAEVQAVVAARLAEIDEDERIERLGETRRRESDIDIEVIGEVRVGPDGS